MEDNKETVDDAHGGGGGTDATEEQQTQDVAGKEFHSSRDVEVNSEIERRGGERSGESDIGEPKTLCSAGNPKVLGDGKVFQADKEIPSSIDANDKESCPIPAAIERASSEGRSHDEKCEEEANVVVPEVLSSVESGSRDEEMGKNLLPTVVLQDKPEIEAEVKGMEFEIENAKQEPNGAFTEKEIHPTHELKELKNEHDIKPSGKSFLLDGNDVSGDECGTEEEQAAFMKELETFHRERCLDFKPPKFYQEPLNCLKLWRAVIRLGGYEQVTALKLWRQVGESFRPPKTCTTVSWTFRGFYEKALLEYEKYKMRCGELPFTDTSLSDPASGIQVDLSHASGSGRARRDAAARAMQGWHSQRILGNGEVGDPIIKEKIPIITPKREKQLRNIGFLKRKGSSPAEHAVKVARVAPKSQMDIIVVDVGIPADWVKVNVQKMKDCYEVYALVPGLLREEVLVQSDPAGRLVISGQPEQQDNPWGVAPFKKVVSLPTRIDPHQTSAVVTLHGQLFVRVPFEQSDV